METIESQEEILKKQEDLLILEKERNLELEELLAIKKEKVEKLTKQLSLANESIASLKGVNDTLHKNFKYLDETHKALEVQFDTLWSSISSSSNDAKAPLMPPLVKGVQGVTTLI